MPNIIDETVSMFSSIAEKTQRKVVWDLQKLYTPNDMELVREMITRDFGTAILRDYGMAGTIDDMADVYASILKQFPDEIMNKIPLGMMETLQELDSQFYFEHIQDVGFELKKTMIQSSIGGTSEADIRDQLLKASAKLTESQIGSLVNTSLRTMSRTAFASGANEMPADTKYTYEGPLDDRTRDYCLDVLSAGAMTQDEINAQFPGAFTDGGGFNCRHSWEVVL